MDYYQLIIKSLTGKLNAEEKSQLEYWIGASEENQILFEEVKLIWENASFENLNLQADEIKEEEEKLLSRIHKIKISKLERRAFIYQIAASVFLLATLSLLTFPFTSTQTDTHKELVFQNSDLEQFLPDSSNIALNRNSTLSYSENENQRKVELRGEAFFNVKKSNKPFIIETSRGTVKVLGTSFNVRSYNEEGYLEVGVISGLVQVFNLVDTVHLTKNKLATITGLNDKIHSETNDKQNFLAWKTKKLDFHETELKEVFRVMEKYYDVDINLDKPQTNNCKFTGKFENIGLRDLLNIISYTMEIEFKITNANKRTTIIITGKGCPKQLQS